MINVWTNCGHKTYATEISTLEANNLIEKRPDGFWRLIGKHRNILTVPKPFIDPLENEILFWTITLVGGGITLMVYND